MTDVNSNDGQPFLNLNLSIDDFECDDFIFVWFDSEASSNAEYEETRRRLQEITTRWRIFSDIGACRAFVVDPKRYLDYVCLIVSRTSNFDLLAANILELPWLTATAIYCSSSVEHGTIEERKEKSDYRFLGAFDELDKLIEAFDERISTLKKSPSFGKFPMFNVTNSSIKNLSRENATFVWNHLLLQNLFHLPRSGMGFDRMVEFCRVYYKNNEKRSSEIENFYQTYKSDQAVNWYTRDSFIYRLVNRALRTQYVEVMFIFAPFIGDLHDQLDSLHKDFLELGAPDVMTVYRGQQMGIDEVKKISTSTNGLISMNTFLSTSFDRQFSRTMSQASSGFVAILYEIIIDTNVSATPFSNIDEHTAIAGEMEILFSVDAMFRVESVTEEKDEIGSFWSIKLHLINERTEQKLTDLIDYLTKKYIAQSSIVTLISLLHYMGELETATKFLLLMHKTLPENDIRLAVVYDQLGALNIYNENIAVEVLFESALDLYTSVGSSLPNQAFLTATTLVNLVCYYTSKDNLEKASEFVQRVLDLEQDCSSTEKESINEYVLSNFINATAILYKMGNAQEALIQYKRILGLCDQLIPSVHPILTDVHEHLDVVHGRLGNLNEALLHHEKSHQIRMQIYPERHPELGRSHNNLGWRYSDHSNFKTAQTHFECALSIHEQFQEWISKEALINTLTGLTSVCRRQGKVDDALKYLTRASKLVTSSQCDDINQIDHQMGRLLIEMGQYTEAHHTLQRALKRSIESKNKLDIAELELTIGQLYCQQTMFECALECFQRALDIRQQFASNATPAIAKILHEIGVVYCHMQQYKQAVEHLRHALALELKSLPKTHIDVARSHNSIATVLWLQKDYPHALKEAEIAVDIALKSLEEADALVITFRQTVAKIYQSLKTEVETQSSIQNELPD